MKNLSEHIRLVKEQVEFHRRQVAKYVDDSRRSAMHERTASGFTSLLDDLLSLQAFQDAHPNWMHMKPPAAQKRLALSWEEVDGLPDEVMRELSISEADRTEFNIIAGIRAMGGVASLDRIIVYLWKEHGDLQKRPSLNQRLYRMTQREVIHGVPGKKGVYSSEPITEDEAAKLL